MEGQWNGCCSSSPWRLTDVPEPTHHSPLLGLTIVVISPVQAHLCPRRSSPWSLNPLTQSYGNPHGFELSPRLTCIQCVPRGIQQILKPCVRSSKANRRQTAEHRYQADEWSHHDEGDLNLPNAAKTRGVLGPSPRPSRSRSTSICRRRRSTTGWSSVTSGPWRAGCGGGQPRSAAPRAPVAPDPLAARSRWRWPTPNVQAGPRGRR
jgi:hypothetical protein